MGSINLIRNCVVKFRDARPETWGQLSSASAESVKFCGTCSREVFLGETDADGVDDAATRVRIG
jgi:hypothetical protein